MDKIKELVVKYKVHILVALLVIFFFRSCGRGRTISKLERNEKANIEVLDSLSNVIKTQKATLDSFPEIMRNEKLSVYLGLDDKISRLDRGRQMMKLHATIKDSILTLQK